MSNIQVNDEVIYCGYFATVKEIADHKNTALVSTPLFPSVNVWVPLSQLKPRYDE